MGQLEPGTRERIGKSLRIGFVSRISTWCLVPTPCCARSLRCTPADAQEKFVHDFVAAWDKVMNLDRFDLA